MLSHCKHRKDKATLTYTVCDSCKLSYRTCIYESMLLHLGLEALYFVIALKHEISPINPTFYISQT